MLPPLPRCSGWAYSTLISPSHISLPRKGRRVGLHIVLFEACSALTRVAACTLARPPTRGPLYRRLQPFGHLHDCSGCFRLERVAGWAFHPLENAAFSRRTPIGRLWRGLQCGRTRDEMLGVPLCPNFFEGSAVGPLPPNPPPPRSLGLVALRVPITTSERATLANDPCTVIPGH